MALPVTIPNTFANATSSIPLANLDANFVTIYGAVNGIGNGAEALANVSISGGNATFTTANATTVDATNVEVTNIKAKDGTAAGSIADATGVVTLASSVLTTADINGGTIDATTVGATTPATGSFTTLNTSGQVVFNDAGADVDFRVEGDTDANLLFVDASTDRVGIGTSSPAAGAKLTAAGAILTTAAFSSTTESSGGIDYSGGGLRLFSMGTSGATKGAFTFIAKGADDSDTVPMRINSDGNVGIGTNAPSSIGTLTVAGASNKGIILRQNTSTDRMRIFVGDGSSGFATDVNYIASSNTDLVFIAGNPPDATNERMRITSAGNVLVNTTGLPVTNGNFAVNGSGRFFQSTEGSVALIVDKASATTTSAQQFLAFTISNQSVGSGIITANGASQAAFGSFSDVRLKENIVDLPSQLENICALRPVEFDYIASEGSGHQISFIAQEFEEIYPDAIGERSDGMKTLTGWSKTEARLVKAIQEQQALITALTARVAALEGA